MMIKNVVMEKVVLKDDWKKSNSNWELALLSTLNRTRGFVKFEDIMKYLPDDHDNLKEAFDKSEDVKINFLNRLEGVSITSRKTSKLINSNLMIRKENKDNIFSNIKLVPAEIEVEIKNDIIDSIERKEMRNISINELLDLLKDLKSLNVVNNNLTNKLDRDFRYYKYSIEISSLVDKNDTIGINADGITFAYIKIPKKFLFIINNSEKNEILKDIEEGRIIYHF